MDAARLRALITVAGASAAQRDIEAVGRTVTRTQRHLDKMATTNLSRGVKHIAGGLANLGAAAGVVAAGGLVYAAKQAIAFEDAMAGVRKTVEGTPKQLAELDQQLRSLSTRIPVKYEDLAGIAQEAGALNVPRERIAKFTDVIARLSAATVGLSTDMAAEAFGKFGTIFPEQLQHTTDGYEKMGSALVALGNQASSSESDIVAVTKRFAAAGNKAGLSIPQILGFSSAISSLGVEPEAAGGAMSRILNKITTLIGTMDDPKQKKKLTALAGVAGMTAKQFAKAFADDAPKAIQTFLRGLDGLDKFKGARALSLGGLTNVRDVNVLQLLSKQYPELARQIALANKAYSQNTELQDVSSKRFDTLKNKLTVFGNLIQLTAARIGEGFTPALGRLVDKATLQINAHMPELVKLGQDIGAAIDSIDWNEVQIGAGKVADAAKSILDVVKQIPPEIGLSVAAWVGLNKVTGGALGSIAGGALDIGKGILGMGGRLASLLGGGSILGRAGGAASSLAATPVFVTNMPAGGFGGGLPGAAAGAAGGLTLAGALAGITAIIAPLAVGAVGYKISSDITQQGADLSTASNRFAGAATDAELQNSIKGLTETIDAMGTGIGSNIFNQKGIAVEQLNILIAESNRRSAQAAIDAMRQGPPTPEGWGDKERGWAMHDHGAVNASYDPIVLMKGWNAYFRKLRQDLEEARSAVTVTKTAKALMKEVLENHRGGGPYTASVLHTLRAQRKAATDPALIHLLDGYIKAVEKRLPERQWASRTLAHARKIAEETGDLGTRIDKLKAMQKQLTERHHPATALAIAGLIAKEKREAHDLAVQSALKASQRAADAIRHHKWKVTVVPAPVILNMDGRAIAEGTYRAVNQFTREG